MFIFCQFSPSPRQKRVYIYTLVKSHNINIVNPLKHKCIKLIFHFKKSKKKYLVIRVSSLELLLAYYFLKQKKNILTVARVFWLYKRHWGGGGGRGVFIVILVSLEVLRVFWLF